MTEHERDRLTKLEVTSTQMAQDIHQIRLTVEHLREAFHMGRGASFVVVKLGWGLLGAFALVAWVREHLRDW